MPFLLPFKGLGSAKSRWPDLGGRRDPLALRLLQHNLAIVSQASQEWEVYLVTPRWDAGLALQGARLLQAPGRGLNEDLTWARHTLEKGARPEPLVVLLPDLPTLSLHDVEALMEEATQHEVVICPDEKRTGTNALSLRRWDSMNFRFEGASFARHCQEAARLSLTVSVLERDGLARDCDDLAALERYSLL